MKKMPETLYCYKEEEIDGKGVHHLKFTKYVRHDLVEATKVEDLQVALEWINESSKALMELYEGRTAELKALDDRILKIHDTIRRSLNTRCQEFSVNEFQALCKEHWICSNSRTIAKMIHENFPNGIAIIDNGEKE